MNRSTEELFAASIEDEKKTNVKRQTLKIFTESITCSQKRFSVSLPLQSRPQRGVASIEGRENNTNVKRHCKTKTLAFFVMFHPFFFVSLAIETAKCSSVNTSLQKACFEDERPKMD